MGKTFSDFNKKPNKKNTNNIKQDLNIEVTEEFNNIHEALSDDKNKFIFVSGVAGTGKTSLISQIKELYSKSMVVAPTGIAAMNAGGVTIHSLFRLPIGPMPEPAEQYGFKRQLLESLELLIIDEISMVKADVLDSVSYSLQMHRNNNEAFGGLKIIAFGDLFQLSPVHNEDDLEILKANGYESSFFFQAHDIQNIQPTMLQLTKVFRQKDQNFKNLLNNIRVGKNLKKTIDEINKACIKKATSTKDHLTLTTRTENADIINRQRLSKLKGEELVYSATHEGDYFDHKKLDKQLPAPRELILKKNSRVIFVKNNGKVWVNGTLGTVVNVESTSVLVKIDNGEIVRVEPSVWEHFRHKLNPETEKIEREVVASFKQVPLRLGWAVTIHKSQGLTLDNCTVDVGEDGAFTHGQLYVALSRCRSLESLSLTRPIQLNDVILDETVVRFYSEFLN